MNRCAGLILRVIAATTLVACLALGAHLAWHARAESGEQGAGAAQGDLGFYFVLVVATPVAAALVAVAKALEAVSTLGLFENDAVQAPLSGFFAEVFRANPAALHEWVKPFVGW